MGLTCDYEPKPPRELKPWMLATFTVIWLTLAQFTYAA